MYPILIIIFSVLFFFCLIYHNRRNILNEQFNKIYEHYLDNNKFDYQLYNGKWTSYNSTINSNNTITNPINITIFENPLSVDFKNKKMNSLGRLLYNSITYNIFNNPELPLYQNDILQCTNDDKEYIIIKLLNKIENNNDIVNISSENNNLIAVFTILTYNNVLNQFISYKLYDNFIPNNALEIIKSGKNIINNFKNPLNIELINNLVNDYKYPSSNLIIFSFGKTNDKIFDIIKNNYNGILQFSIQRVFQIKNSTNLITKNSMKIKLNAINNNSIPQQIVISSLIKEFKLNKFDENIIPIATILYFYKLQEQSNIFDYNNPDKEVSITEFKLKNNANNIYKSNIIYNDILSVRKKVSSIYTMTYINKFSNNLNDDTFIDFSILYPYLISNYNES
jgi:hypothetical protein